MSSTKNILIKYTRCISTY